MVCFKCGYKDKKEVELMGASLCSLCSIFAPNTQKEFESYINDKIDWKVLESFRGFGVMPGSRQKKGMKEKVNLGGVVNRAPLGYDSREGKLVQNLDSAKVHSLFKTFLKEDNSLNKLSKMYGLSINGLKKVLRNRAYLGEIKFDGEVHKSSHKPTIAPEIFYAVQRKLDNYLKLREHQKKVDEVEEIKKEEKEEVTSLFDKQNKNNTLYSSVFK